MQPRCIHLNMLKEAGKTCGKNTCSREKVPGECDASHRCSQSEMDLVRLNACLRRNFDRHPPPRAAEAQSQFHRGKNRDERPGGRFALEGREGGFVGIK